MAFPPLEISGSRRIMPKSASARTRVLIVDDDEKLNRLLTEYLGTFGFSVRTVAHPEQGLRALSDDPPDILILDVMLPDMDGFAVCRKIRETSGIPIWEPTTIYPNHSSHVNWWRASRPFCVAVPRPLPTPKTA